MAEYVEGFRLQNGDWWYRRPVVGSGGGTPTLNEVLDPTADKTFAMGGKKLTLSNGIFKVGPEQLPAQIANIGRTYAAGLVSMRGETGDYAQKTHTLAVSAASNDGAGDADIAGLLASAIVPTGGTAMDQVVGAQISSGVATGASSAYIAALETSIGVVGTCTDAYGINVGNVAGATNNYAIKTGAGRVSIGGLTAYANNAAAIAAGLAAGDLYIVAGDPALVAIVT